jgi:hypothetical protein
MKITTIIIGILLAGILFSNADNWSISHPSVVALQSADPSDITMAESTYSNAVVAFNLVGIPPARKNQVSHVGMQAFDTLSFGKIKPNIPAAQRIINATNILNELATNQFALHIPADGINSSNRVWFNVVRAYLGLGDTNAANLAASNIQVGAGIGAGPKVRALIYLGYKAQALNLAEAATNQNSAQRFITVNNILEGTGFSESIFNNTNLWENYVTNLNGRARIRDLVVGCLTDNFPSAKSERESAKLQLMWLRVNAGNDTNKVTQLRKFLRKIAGDASPATQHEARSIGWLRGFHRSLSATMPDPKEPSTPIGPTPTTNSVGRILEGEDVLFGLRKPDMHSSWGYIYKNYGFTKEQAERWKTNYLRK